MKNKMIDLNNHLFAQLERLSDEDIGYDQLQKEIARSHAIVTVAEQIVDTANVAIEAAKLVAEYGGNYEAMLPMVDGKNKINDAIEHPAIAPPKGKANGKK